MLCLRCAKDALVGLLCDECAHGLEHSPPLCLEQVTMIGGGRERVPGPALVDQWGRSLHLDDTMLIGRQLEQRGISVFEASVSRHHARLEPVRGGWEVRDLGSSNGTFVNEEAVTRPRTLANGDLLRFGSAAFYFFENTPVGLPAAPQAARRTFRPDDRAATASDLADAGIEGLEARSVRVWSPTGGGGGIVEVDGEQVQLATSQFELFELLAERMKQDGRTPAPVRGYVRTSELLGSLSWDTAHPADNHVKQLVRRLRKSLEAAGIGDLIESRHGFGYRLRVLPRE